jgi:hypothetical protein
VDQSAQPLLRLATLLRDIDEQFTQQLDRLAYHQDETNNDYRAQEARLSALMLDKTISDEKHLEYARKIIALNDTYKQGFIRSLQNLNDAIERDLLAFEQALKQTPGLRTIGDMERWLNEDEHVAVLLCESVQSVNEIVAIVRVADMTDAKGWFQKARVLADRAKRAGFDIPAVEEKLSALKSVSGP